MCGGVYGVRGTYATLHNDVRQARAVQIIDVEPRTYIHWTAVFCRSRRFASGGVSCKGHELRRGSPDFRSASHCMELPNIERILAVNKTV